MLDAPLPPPAPVAAGGGSGASRWSALTNRCHFSITLSLLPHEVRGVLFQPTGDGRLAPRFLNGAISAWVRGTVSMKLRRRRGVPCLLRNLGDYSLRA